MRRSWSLTFLSLRTRQLSKGCSGFTNNVLSVILDKDSLFIVFGASTWCWSEAFKQSAIDHSSTPRDLSLYLIHQHSQFQHPRTATTKTLLAQDPLKPILCLPTLLSLILSGLGQRLVSVLAEASTHLDRSAFVKFGVGEDYCSHVRLY